MTLPTDPDARKDVPMFSGLMMYFPDALAAVAECSRIGHEQHNPGTPIFWDRSKSGDERDALLRHLLEAGTTDTDGVRHSAKVAWRALAALQKEIEDTTEPPRGGMQQFLSSPSPALPKEEEARPWVAVKRTWQGVPQVAVVREGEEDMYAPPDRTWTGSGSGLYQEFSFEAAVRVADTLNEAESGD